MREQALTHAVHLIVVHRDVPSGGFARPADPEAAPRGGDRRDAAPACDRPTGSCQGAGARSRVRYEPEPAVADSAPVVVRPMRTSSER
jgi:hypothetical protein